MASMPAQETRTNVPMLSQIDDDSHLQFEKPVKRIHDGQDVAFFLTSLAYRDIMTFTLQLNRSMVPRKILVDDKQTSQSWPLGSNQVALSDSVLKLRALIAKLEAIVSEAPPDTGPRRFGNVSFRTWHHLVQERTRSMMTEILPPHISSASDEIEEYLLGSFGSPQRLDYGSGHELSFLAFLGCLWKMHFFSASEPGVEERGIVLGVFAPYLDLVRNLIKTYNLEPAGSHGVWGLDDNSFLPYVFGSAQFSPAIDETEETPIEGSIANAPEPSSVAKANLVEKQKSQNLYFSAVAFIFDVKRGPFWEHSPMLYDISGIRDGWGKINKGMIKMYNAEVLAKFPVVQHFPFGSLFRWQKDPEAKEALSTTHTANQPLRNANDMNAPATTRSGGPPQTGAGTAAPWATRPAAPPVGMVDGVTRAPWAKTTSLPPRGVFNTQRAPPSLRAAPADHLHRPRVPQQPALVEEDAEQKS